MKQSQKKARKLSESAGVDKELFANREPSKELADMRKEWTEEFDSRIREM